MTAVSSQCEVAAAQRFVDGLVADAEIIAGQFGYVDDALRARIVTQVAALDPARLASNIAGTAQLRALIARRIELKADRAFNPGIADETIEAPIFVIGAGRTGTSLIHSLLAEDPAAQAPKWWHSHVPSPPPGLCPPTAMRLKLATNDLERMLFDAPGLLKVHPYWDKGADALIEDEELFTLDFHNSYPSLLYRIPNVLGGIGAADPVAAYAFHHEMLQHLQWRSERQRWVCKGVYHQWALEALFERYPDARCIWPHRDPAQVYPSVLAIIATLYGAISHWTLDWKTIGRSILERTTDQLKRTLANPVIDDPRILHVDFRDLARDPVDLIRSAYVHWDLPCTTAFQDRMTAWLADPANKPDRYGRHSYDLSPFGIEPDEIGHLFVAYRERFKLA